MLLCNRLQVKPSMATVVVIRMTIFPTRGPFGKLPGRRRRWVVACIPPRCTEGCLHFRFAHRALLRRPKLSPLGSEQHESNASSGTEHVSDKRTNRCCEVVARS